MIEENNKYTLTTAEYKMLSYEAIILLDDYGLINVDNRNRYQHNVGFINFRNKSLELRAGWFKTPSIFLEDRTVEPMIQKNIRIENNFKYVELIMNKKNINILEHQKDNFPREINFLDENKQSILILKFNEFGFMIKAIDKLGKIILEDKEVENKEEIKKYIRKKEKIREEIIENKILEKISTPKLLKELKKRKKLEK